jgi:hypothetical protein
MDWRVKIRINPVMYGHPHAHDDDFLFEQQRDRSDPWFRPAEEVTPPVHKEDSLEAIGQDVIRLFRRLVRCALKGNC